MKLAYFGYLPQNEEVIGGGEVKTRSVLGELKMRNDIEMITEYNTSSWKKRLPIILGQIIKAIICSDVIVFVAGTPSFIKILPFVQVFNILFNTEIHFIPVGNCSVRYFEKKKNISLIKKVKGIYVQTELMKNRLKNIGLDNVFVMHNFKRLETFCIEDYRSTEPLNFCYLSRVSEEKGIFDAIEVLKKVNQKGIRVKLDIYGKIDENIRKKFLKLVEDNNQFIQYYGVINPLETSKIIKNYFMMLFPTKFDGEGFPGTLLDAFAAGVPILSSKFAFYDNLLKDGVTGMSFPFNDYSALYDRILQILDNPDKIIKMRKLCAQEYFKYAPEKEIEIMVKQFKDCSM